MITRKEIQDVLCSMVMFLPAGSHQAVKLRQLMNRIADCEVVEYSAPPLEPNGERTDLEARIAHLEQVVATDAILHDRARFWKAQAKGAGQACKDLRDQLKQARDEQRAAWEKIKQIHELSKEDIPF